MHKYALVALAVALTGIPVAEAKPTAPVIVYLTSRPVAGGYEVTLVAVPREDVPALELDLGTKHVVVGATQRGYARSVTAMFPMAPGNGSDVVGVATVPHGRGVRNAVTELHVGAPALREKRIESVRTRPDGSEVLEVQQ